MEWRRWSASSLPSWLFFFSSRRRHTRYWRDWSSDVCSSDLTEPCAQLLCARRRHHAFGGANEQLILHQGSQAVERMAQCRLAHPEPFPRTRHAQIGRASCRERAYIYVVAVSHRKVEAVIGGH